MTAQQGNDYLLRPGMSTEFYMNNCICIFKKKRTYTLYTDYVIILEILDDDFFEQDIENGKPIYL